MTSSTRRISPPSTVTTLSATMTTPSMPSRFNTSAPKFDPDQPHELLRYFEELDASFKKCSIVDDTEKKLMAKRYLNCNSDDLWGQLPEYKAAHSYEEFVKAIRALYPGANEGEKWTIADMDKTIGERARLKIINITDLGEYHRCFLAITTFLISKGDISEVEQSRAFIRGIQPDLWECIYSRLQIKQPDHGIDDHYKLADIYSAAKFILQGLTHITSATSQSATATATKTEDLVENILEKYTQVLLKVLSQQSSSSNASNNANSGNISRTYNTESLNALLCFLCGGPGHIGANCIHLPPLLASGKMKRNVENKLVLPSGTFVP
jgi:hypothetical protein